MKTTLHHAHALSHAERGVVIDRALFIATHLRHLPAPQERPNDKSGFQPLRHQAHFRKLPAAPLMQQPHHRPAERPGQASGMAGKRGRCTPACTGCEGVTS